MSDGRSIGHYRTYHVIAVFTGECCSRPHLWSQTVKARSEKEARARLASIIKRSGRTPYETMVLPADSRKGLAGSVPEELPSKYWEGQ